LVENLVENALRYNHPDGWLSVQTFSRDGRAVLKVSNSGTTIREYAVDSLFEPFRRLGTSRTNTDHKGSGLGLSISCAIAEAHGGEASAHARPDGGLEVEIALPDPTVPAPRLRLPNPLRIAVTRSTTPWLD
jgi:signal transduction histidine kinase